VLLVQVGDERPTELLVPLVSMTSYPPFDTADGRRELTEGLGGALADPDLAGADQPVNVVTPLGEISDGRHNEVIAWLLSTFDSLRHAGADPGA
jgi:hypothetical protein